MQPVERERLLLQTTHDSPGGGATFVVALDRCEVEGAILHVDGWAHQRDGMPTDVVLSYEAATYTDRVSAVHDPARFDPAERIDRSCGFRAHGLVVVEPGILYLDMRGADGETRRERLGMVQPDPETGAPHWTPVGAALAPQDRGGPAWDVGSTFEGLPQSRHAGPALLKFGAPPQTGSARRPVSILVSIPAGSAPDALFKNLRDTNGYDEIILVDTDAADAGRLQRFAVEAARIPRCRLISQAVHQGAIRGVSAAFAARAFRGHVVVIDSDIELPPGWLGRLIWPLDNLPQVGSATPFTDAGPRCSPASLESSAALHRLDVATIDRAFQAIDPRRLTVPLPSGVGFCMAMHADAIATLGFFEGSTFAFGPGEEIDWCLRAQAKGWRDLLVPNLFVRHTHAGTGSDSHRDLLRRNLETVNRLHPAYADAVAHDRRSDPTAAIRAIIAFRLARQACGGPVRMIALGVDDQCGRVVADLARGDPLVVVLFEADRRRWSALLAVAGRRDQVWGSGAAELSALRAATGVPADEVTSEVGAAPAMV